jgi:transcriptional regulator with XRE-family HTH domain
MTTFGQRLRRLRQQRMLSQTELAELVGVHQEQVSRWERRGVRPRPAMQRQLCQALGVSADDLLGGKAIPEDRP